MRDIILARVCQVEELNRLLAAAPRGIGENCAHVERKRRQRKVQGVVPVTTELQLFVAVRSKGCSCTKMTYLKSGGHIPTTERRKKRMMSACRKWINVSFVTSRSAAGSASLVMLPCRNAALRSPNNVTPRFATKAAFASTCSRTMSMPT